MLDQKITHQAKEKMAAMSPQERSQYLAEAAQYCRDNDLLEKADQQLLSGTPEQQKALALILALRMEHHKAGVNYKA